MAKGVTQKSNIPTRWTIPGEVRTALRYLSVSTLLIVWVLLLIRPQLGLLLFWQILIPLLPLIFFVAPSLWRDICPMVLLNQVPRLFRFTRGLSQPKWFQKWSYVISVGLFVLIVPARKVLFNENGPATALLILFALVGAFVGGVLFKGKSGWCGTICPLAAVERLYGQTPLLSVPHSHCKPCVGCMKSCHDLKPDLSYKRELDYLEPFFRNTKKFFGGAFPGFVLAFYALPDPPAISLPTMIFWFAVCMTGSYGFFRALDADCKDKTHRFMPMYAAAALNLYYWFNTAILCRAFTQLTTLEIPDWQVGVAQFMLFVLSTSWVIKVLSMRKNTQLTAQRKATDERRANDERRATDRSRTSNERRPSDRRKPADDQVQPVLQRLPVVQGKRHLPVLQGCAQFAVSNGCARSSIEA